MREKINWTAELLFWFQVLNSWIFGVSQAMRMWDTTEGVAITWFIFWEVSLAISLYLAAHTYRAKKDRITLQTIIIFLNWAIVVGGNLVVMLVKGSVWSGMDTRISILVCGGVLVTLLVVKLKRKSVSDPIVKGCLAVSFKSLPQLDLAYRVLTMGGAGLSPVMIINGHLTILTRIGQLLASLQQTGKNRDTIGNLINESVNEATWIVVTVALVFFQRALS